MNALDDKCQKWKTLAAVKSAPCPHFQKLDIGINKKNYNLGLDIFTLAFAQRQSQGLDLTPVIDSVIHL